MLNGDGLATAITAVLIGAVALGWALHWLWLRASSAPLTETARLAELVNRLDDADRAREAAEEARALAESLLAEREAETGERLEELQARLDGAMGEREGELASALREARAEAEAVMSGLRNARRRIMELEEEIEEMRRVPR